MSIDGSTSDIYMPHLLSSLVSRDGYVVVDDTHRPHFDDSNWPWVVNTTYPQPNASDCTPIPPEEVCVCVCACMVAAIQDMTYSCFRELTVAFQELLPLIV